MISEIVIVLITIYVGFLTYTTVKKRYATVDFKNKLIWITGASSGIGQALAIQMSNLGADIILTARNQAQLEEVKKLCNAKSRVIILPMDISRPQECQEKTKLFLDGLEREKKFVNIMVHNAGRSMRAQFLDFSYQNHVEMTNLNYSTPYVMSQLLVKHMRNNLKNELKQFVIISSVAKLASPAYRSSYSGSKNAISALFDSLRVETYDEGIKVTQILPGFIVTNADKNAFSQEAGSQCNKVDEDIKNGMSIDKFTDEACRCIFFQEIERVIAKAYTHHLVCFLRNLLPDLVFFFTHNYYVKNQKNRFS